MGGGGGHEQHTSSAPGLHGGRLADTDTGIHVPRAIHWEVWVWQGVSSQVERRLCPECSDGGSGRYWDLFIAGGVCGGAGATADGRRCREKPRPYWERRYIVTHGDRWLCKILFKSVASLVSCPDPTLSRGKGSVDH